MDRTEKRRKKRGQGSLIESLECPAELIFRDWDQEAKEGSLGKLKKWIRVRQDIQEG